MDIQLIGKELYPTGIPVGVQTYNAPLLEYFMEDEEEVPGI